MITVQNTIPSVALKLWKPAGSRLSWLRAMSVVTIVVVSTPLSSLAQQTTIRGFTDVTFSSSTREEANGSFAIGQFDLFISSRLSDNVMFLGETVFEYDEGDPFVDIERVLITFAPENYFWLVAGKHHTPIGYWNTQYHHGALIQPTIQRPLPFLFEDEGGVLPIHTTGLQVSGRDISEAHLSYDFLVGNGVGSTDVEDNSENKSITASLRSEVTSSLTVGLSYYLDKLVAGTLNLGAAPIAEKVTEQMAGAFIASFGSRIELLAEYLRIIHTMDSSPTSTTNAFYAYAGLRFGNIVPYGRFDLLDYPASDPYFIVDSARQGLLGIRYDISAAAGVKIEARRYRTDSAGSENQFAAQFAVGF